MKRAARLLNGIAFLLVALPCQAAPTIYAAPAFQSPARADPDDLLLLSGYGFASDDTVVYRAIANTTQALANPASIPVTSTDAFGVADLVSVLDVPYSLTIHLPATMTINQSYAIWVVNAKGEWSNGVKINDARPLWITPDEVYSSAALASLPRVLKVVGRNQQPAPGASTLVRLIGAQATYTVTAESDSKPASAIDRYVARIHLPTKMPVGQYRVQVSRDGTSWVPLVNAGRETGQALRVLADPEVRPRFRVGDYIFGTCLGSNSCPAVRGHCLPDGGDDNDQTLCIGAAIAAAESAGGGTVEFGPGIWVMNSPGPWAPGRDYSNKGVSYDGLLVPNGVSLEGAGSAVTTVIRGSNWDIHLPSFVLQGNNTISGFTFRDSHVYQRSDSGTALLMLGAKWNRMSPYHLGHATTVSHVVITRNTFDKPYYAVGNNGLAIDHLFVTDNLFGAFKTALFWEGDPANTAFRYRFSDSVVAYNRFYPGSFIDTANVQGTIATELSGGNRIDFSDNIADGTSSAYLYHPETDAKGWRAAHFWAMHDNVEMMLVSRNSVTCAGDKDGDGEAIAYDNNHNRPGFHTLMAPVLAATSDLSSDRSMLTVQGALIETQISYGVPINVRPVTDYYVGDWLQVVQGPGIGQARKITAIRTGRNANGDTVSFTVTPAFDVLPQTSSWITDGRMFWQTYTVDNVIDERIPLCLKSNRTRRAGGLITLYAATADSVVEGNIQYDTSGISLQHQFELTDANAGVTYPGAFVQSFNEIRGNFISGRYDVYDRTPQAEYGIAMRFATTPNTAPPPTISYGIAISHNTVDGGGGPRGAISLNTDWYTGPQSRAFLGVTPWKIADATLLFKNTLTNTHQPEGAEGVIGLSAGTPAAPIEWRTVLFGNLCKSETGPGFGLVDLGTETVRFCPSVSAGSCECLGHATDLGIASLSAPLSVPVGSAATCTLLITNNGSFSATGGTFSVEPPPGLTINSVTGAGVTCDTADPNVNLCHLGDLNAGASKTINVAATINEVGPVETQFSVGHKEADDNVKNDSVAITIQGIAKR